MTGSNEMAKNAAEVLAHSADLAANKADRAGNPERAQALREKATYYKGEARRQEYAPPTRSVKL